MRGHVVFANMCVMTMNVWGTQGKKNFVLVPYSMASSFSFETSGVIDLNSELEMHFSGLGKVKFEFAGNSNIAQIGQMISSCILR